MSSYIKQIAVAAAVAVAMASATFPVQAADDLKLFSVKWNIGSKVANTKHHMNFGGIIGNTGMALASFRQPKLYARHKGWDSLTDGQKAGLVIGGAVLVAVIASNSGKDKKKKCRTVVHPGNRPGPFGGGVSPYSYQVCD